MDPRGGLSSISLSYPVWDPKGNGIVAIGSSGNTSYCWGKDCIAPDSSHGLLWVRIWYPPHSDVSLKGFERTNALIIASEKLLDALNLKGFVTFDVPYEIIDLAGSLVIVTRYGAFPITYTRSTSNIVSKINELVTNGSFLEDVSIASKGLIATLSNGSVVLISSKDMRNLLAKVNGIRSIDENAQIIAYSNYTGVVIGKGTNYYYIEGLIGRVRVIGNNVIVLTSDSIALIEYNGASYSRVYGMSCRLKGFIEGAYDLIVICKGKNDVISIIELK
ncbi:hypothetical protein EYM_02480 [Ignicoccus islandicus DSM 13165]|uniref:Uncharacterized protein n=1 Tax=Ignicoccus islandicus DSM 13165 TaxID=940295 RepID=A0A0U3F8I8_9CREN|nr:hypothetical protein [Ignicoccus islandicus]ALU12328.1 hypothetical protein EYM_02480 [Ignicoccus islandicus DSM 13165]